MQPGSLDFNNPKNFSTVASMRDSSGSSRRLQPALKLFFQVARLWFFSRAWDAASFVLRVFY